MLFLNHKKEIASKGNQAKKIKLAVLSLRAFCDAQNFFEQEKC